MEKEKKPRTTKKTSTTTTQPNATEAAALKKTTARKKAGPVAIDAKAAEPKKATKAATEKKTPTAVPVQPISHEQIARLAHRYWAERGHQHGNHQEDWLRAERELRGKAS